MKKSKRGGKRERAGRPELPPGQKSVPLGTLVNPNIREFLDKRISEGHTVAGTVDYAIRTAYPEYFTRHFTEIIIKD